MLTNELGDSVEAFQFINHYQCLRTTIKPALHIATSKEITKLLKGLLVKG